jgi:hypothetical protein
MRRGSKSVEIGIGVKPTRAQVGIAVVVVASSWTNAKFMAVGVDKDAVSRTHEDGGVEDASRPLGRAREGDAAGGGASRAAS